MQKEKVGLDNIRGKLIELKDFIEGARSKGEDTELDAREFYDKKNKLEALIGEYKSSNPTVQKGTEALRSQVVGFSLHMSEEKHVLRALALLERLKSTDEKGQRKRSHAEVETVRDSVHESAHHGKDG